MQASIKVARFAKWCVPLFLSLAVLNSETPAQTLVLEDLLQGSSTGTRSGGSFVSGGWQVTNQYDAIYWHIPTVTHGAAEWDIRELFPNESRPAMDDKTELFHMYDYTFNNADTNYGGYRDNPYKHFVRKIGSVGGTTDALALVWQISAQSSRIRACSGSRRGPPRPRHSLMVSRQTP